MRWIGKRDIIFFERTAVAEAAWWSNLESAGAAESLTIARFMPLAERKILLSIGMQANWPVFRIRERSRREEINVIERGDDFTAGEQLFQIVAIAELFVAEDAQPKIRDANPGLV
jgi:hypothetical protein